MEGWKQDQRRKNSNKGRHSEGTVRSNAGLDPDDVREEGAGWRRRLNVWGWRGSSSLRVTHDPRMLRLRDRNRGISATDLLPMLLQPQRPDKEDELFRIK